MTTTNSVEKSVVTALLTQWRELLFMRPPNEASNDELLAWLKNVVAVSAQYTIETSSLRASADESSGSGSGSGSDDSDSGSDYSNSGSDGSSSGSECKSGSGSKSSDETSGSGRDQGGSKSSARTSSGGSGSYGEESQSVEDSIQSFLLKSLLYRRVFQNDLPNNHSARLSSGLLRLSLFTALLLTTCLSKTRQIVIMFFF